jgi:putative membrane protein
VAGVGREPPSRAGDHLANERTLLAWIRTCLSIIVFGFVVARFGIVMRELLAEAGRLPHPERPVGSVYLGAVLVAIGILFTLSAWLHYARTRTAIEQDRFHSGNRALIVLAAVVALFGVGVIGYLIVTGTQF